MAVKYRRALLDWLFLAVPVLSQASPPYVEWLQRFGHDDFTYPSFILNQMVIPFAPPDHSHHLHYGRILWLLVSLRLSNSLLCESQASCTCFRTSGRPLCRTEGGNVDWRTVAAGADQSLSFCVAKTWLLEHMPAFGSDFIYDLYILTRSEAKSLTCRLELLAPERERQCDFDAR